MNRYGNWDRDYAIGKSGEDYVKKLMAGRGKKVEDVTDNPTYRKKDIDFLIDGKTVEVKTDMRIHQTNNIWLEDTIYHHDSGDEDDGWWRKCEAEYIFYLDGVSYDLYIFERKDIVEYLKKNRARKTAANDFNQYREGYCIYYKRLRHQVIKAA